MSRWLSKLNPEQKQAVKTTSGPLLVLAGAGSGKTRVITHRVAFLMEQGVRGEEILGLTFTNKAAEEMRARLRKMVGPASANPVTLSTFHSLGLMMLRGGGTSGKESRFAIFDTGDQLGVLRELVTRLNLGRNFDLSSILTRISAMKNSFIAPGDEPASDDPYDEATALLYPRYIEQLSAYAAYDFDDLVCEPCRRLEQDAAWREHWQQRFRYVLVDEYQDTNDAQLRFLKALVGKERNICVVGDDDQSIYGWRGAQVRNILQFEKDFPGATKVYLMRNYRSVGSVLELANTVISENPDRHPKQLLPTRELGRRVRLMVAPDGEAEAQWVAREIQGAVSSGRHRQGDIAVLYRSNILARGLEGDLREQGIAYRVLGGQAFYESREVKDLLGYLRLLANPADEISLRRVINSPSRGIGPKTVQRLAQWAEDHQRSLFQTAQAAEEALDDDGRAIRAVDGFTSLIEQTRRGLGKGQLAEGLRGLVQRLGLIEEIERTSTSSKALDRRLGGVAAFIASVEAFERRNPGATLRDFLSRIALSGADEGEGDKGDVVTLCTLHGAKGLEWPLVFLIGLEEGFLPHDRTMNPQENDLYSGDIAEERRLLYVGITRARDELVLSRATERLTRGRLQPRTPSRFFDTVDETSFELDDLTAVPDEGQMADMMANLRAMLGGG
ncbi:MAG: UvrD-helicase domain-containing protein [Deltaproteobacteria bacterium]|nr:UvrD-helicase domain-containing protein [Deltaproteobacteria bacterium]